MERPGSTDHENTVELSDRIATLQDQEAASGLLQFLGVDGVDVETIEAHRIADLLRTHVLTPENIESEEPLSIEYRLEARRFCDQALLGREPDRDDNERDDCRLVLARVPVRVRMTQPAEGDIDLQLLVGATRHAALTIELHQTELGLRADLGELGAAAREIAAVLEPRHPWPTFDLTGVASIRAQTGALVTAEGSEEVQCDEPAPSDSEAGELQFLFSGLQGGVELDAANGVLRVVDFRLIQGGPSLNLQGTPLVSIDVVTPNNNFGLDLRAPTDGVLDLSFGQPTEYRFESALSRLQGTNAGLDGLYRIAVDGVAKPALRMFDAEPIMRIDAGRLTVTSPETHFTANAGECVSTVEEAEDYAEDRDDGLSVVTPSHLIAEACE